MVKRKAMIRQQEVHRLVDENVTTVTTKIADVEHEIGEMESYYNQAISDIVEQLSVIPIHDSVNLEPVKAKAVVEYGAEEFTITAVDKSSAGNGINITFVDPDTESESLAVVVDEEEKLITVTHATGGDKAITTAAGSLETAINTEAAALVLCTMGQAGTVDFVGDAITEGWESAKVCGKGEVFSDGTNIYLALDDLDGVENEESDYKKIVLASI